MESMEQPVLAKPPHYELNRALPPGHGWAASHIRLSAMPREVGGKTRLLFCLTQMAGLDVVETSPDGSYSYIAITRDIELKIELDESTEWRWDWDNSGPLTCKENQKVAQFFGGAKPGANDREVIFYCKFNNLPTPEEESKGGIYEFNFHVVLRQNTAAELKVTIDPQVVNPPPIGGFLEQPLTSVFAVL